MIRPLYIEDFSFACSLGQSKETVWSKLINGQRECFNKKDFLGTSYYVAELNPEINLPQLTDPFFDGSINRISQAILNPMQDSIQRCINHYGKDRIAIVIGSCDNGSEASLNALSYYKEHNQFPKDYTLDQQRADSPCVYIAQTYGITGIKMNVSTACSSGGSAFTTARNLIYAGLCDAVIVGGIDITSLPVVLGFASLEAVSPEPCNPFSKNRKGITLGNGGAYFIVTKDISENTLLRIRGIGESADADHLTHPQPEGIGAKKSMLSALADAALSSEDIDYLNLHGTGTLLNDSMESIAVNDVFPKAIPVSSTKALTGHTLGGAAALELAFAALTLSQKEDDSYLPVHLWDNEYDPSLPQLYFVEKGFKAPRLKTIMSNSFAFGGCNVSLIIDKINNKNMKVSLPINKEELTKYVPHSGKMLFLSRIVSYDLSQKKIISEVDITTNDLLYDEKLNGVPVWVGFEYMAQSISALSGINDSSLGISPQIGFIISITNFESFTSFYKLGTIVSIEAEEMMRVESAITFKGTVKENNKLLASCTLNVVKVEDPRLII